MTLAIKPAIAIAVAALLLAACGAKQPPADPAVPPPPAAEAPAATPAPAATDSAALTEAAKSTQESVVERERSAAMRRWQRLAPCPSQRPAARWPLEVGHELQAGGPRAVHARRAGRGRSDRSDLARLCQHCYRAGAVHGRPGRRGKADYIKFVQGVPVMWGPAHRSHARLLVHARRRWAARTWSPRPSTRSTSAATCWSTNDDAQSQKPCIWPWRRPTASAKPDFNREYNGFAVNTHLQRAEEVNRRYRDRGRAGSHHQRQVRDRRRHGWRPGTSWSS